MLAQGYRVLGATSREERSIRDRLVILCYHRVLPSESKAAYFQPDLVVTPEALRSHCRTLREHYEVRTLRNAWAELRSGYQHERPLAAITFDDGYRDNIRWAAPILAEFDLKATFLVVSDLVGGDSPPWYDRIGKAVQVCNDRSRSPKEQMELRRILDGVFKPGSGVGERTPRQVVALAKKLSSERREGLKEELESRAGIGRRFGSDDLIMSGAELTQLDVAGHEIGSHSRSHPILPMLDDGTLREEIVGSRAALEAMLGRRVHSFCYPNGDSDERVEQVVREAGYECATSVEFGVNRAMENPFRLRRWFMHEDRLRGMSGAASSALLRMELCGLADRVFRRRRTERFLA